MRLHQRPILRLDQINGRIARLGDGAQEILPAAEAALLVFLACAAAGLDIPVEFARDDEQRPWLLPTVEDGPVALAERLDHVVRDTVAAIRSRRGGRGRCNAGVCNAGGEGGVGS